MSRVVPPFSLFKQPIPAFDPTSIAGLDLWLKADLLGLSNNDPVASWTDLSGNANHATQASSGLRPLFKTGVVNGKAVVRFDGIDDVMAFVNQPGVPATVFVAASVGITPSSLSDYAPFIICGGSNAVRICATSGNANWGTYIFSDLSAGEELVPGDFDVLSLMTTVGATSIYRNGVLKNSGASSCTGGGSNEIGAETPIRYFLGDIAEILLYNSILSAPNRALVNAYLMGEYL